jgi:glutamate-ammonia-ligase adenylyltransferase
VDALATLFLERLRAGRADPELLARAGEAEPERAARAFARALADPDLAADVELWLPELLVGARPGFGAESLLRLAEAARAQGQGPLSPGAACSVARVLAASDFLARALATRPELARELDGLLPAPPEPPPVEVGWEAIRDAKYRGLLRVAARDLGGRPFEQSLKELSDLADGCLAAALARAAEETGVRPPALFALGKLGGAELNLSSDVDLLFLHETGSRDADFARNREVARLVLRFKAELEAPTSAGFAYRVDLDLRPEGPPGALANSVAAALDYYEDYGAEWERQALVRLRPIAGDRAVVEAFAAGIRPFVYRRSVDPGALERVRAMKARIEAARREERRDPEADLKEGPGGIRDVEFLVQALQLFYGGVHAELRTGNVLRALAALAELGILPGESADALRVAYLWLRRAEHALQLADERQLHTMPRQPAEQRALARRMGYRDPEGERARERLLDDWSTVRSRVRAHFESLVLGAGG